MSTVVRKPNTYVLKKEEPPKKTLMRRIFTVRKVIVLLVFLLICLSVFGYFYLKYSRMIDTRFRGDVFVRTTGLFAAPKPLRVGSNLTLASLKSYLDRIGYVESSKDADPKRGRYRITNNTIEIHTSTDAIINGVAQFPSIEVRFGQGGKSITRINELQTKRSLDSTFLEPEMITAISNEKRQRQKIVSFKDLPKDYMEAVIAIEDRQFFEHPGVNFRGIMRALWRDVGEGEIQQGGSSITQQLVKNFFLTPERTLKRKLQEMMIALVLETKLSKEEIFQLYANDIYMGQSGSYSINGVGEAASAYFGKEVVNLTLPESAFLAGLIRGPSLYSPYRDPERAKSRRNQVLDSMVESGFISKDRAEQAKATDVKFQPRRVTMNEGGPYFQDYLQQQLSAEFANRDLARQSYRVYTTIDTDLQRAADKAVNETLADLDKLFSKRRKNPLPPGTLQAALVALDAKNGDILAMVGGRDYAQSQLNRAVDAHRQPGSVFKPIVYATALTSGAEETNNDVITAASRFADEPATFYYGMGKTYSPENFGKVYSNQEVTLRTALVKSLNVVTVRVAEQVGFLKIARMAEKLGLPRPQPFPALALGTAEATPLEIAVAYTAFANSGRLTESRALRAVTNSDGVVQNEVKPSTQQVLRPEVASLMTNIMQDVLNHGTAARARGMGFKANAAGKTGTSRDGWFAGYTSNLVCVVWVGFDDNSELGLEGSQSALPIWTRFMMQALALRPDLAGHNFTMPESLIQAEIDPSTGLLATESCAIKVHEYFLAGTEPTETCVDHSGEDPEEPPLPTPTNALESPSRSEPRNQKPADKPERSETKDRRLETRPKGPRPSANERP